MPANHRVVVTGMGAVSPLGLGCNVLWEGLRNGVSGVDWIREFDVEGWPVRYAGEVTSFDPDQSLVRPSPVRNEKSIQMGLVAAAEALEQAGLLNADQEALNGEVPPVGVISGSGMGPCAQAETSYRYYFDQEWKAVRPTTVPKTMFNALSSHISIYFQLCGASHVVAAACASGTIAIGQAYALVSSGAETIMLCGGADSPLCRSMFAAWTNLRVLARHEDPTAAARPFDRDRNGIVLSEGAAMIVIESLESAQRRGVEILAEIVGYGASSDAHHITAPSQQGQEVAMRRCLESAGVSADDVQYVNAHGTGTEANDSAESHAIRNVFGDRGSSLAVSSTKSMLGHMLGASGAMEFIVCVEAIRQGYVPPTLNCNNPDPDLGLDYVKQHGREFPLELAMSNSFGFGGSNAVNLLGRYH